MVDRIGDDWQINRGLVWGTLLPVSPDYATLKLQTALRSFIAPNSSSTITSNSKSSHALTAYVKSHLFPSREPHSFALWEADLIAHARKLDMEGVETRSMIQEGLIREIAVYERKKHAKVSDTVEEEYVLVEVANARGTHICLLKFEREGVRVHAQRSMTWIENEAASNAAATTCNTGQASTRRRRLLAPVLEARRAPPRALETQRKRAHSTRPAYVPATIYKQTVTCRDTVFSTCVRRVDRVRKIMRFGKAGPRVLDLFVALSTIDKCEQKVIGHGRKWFVAAFVGILERVSADKRIWVDKDTLINGDRIGEIDEDQLQVFLEDFAARKARSISNVTFSLSRFVLLKSPGFQTSCRHDSGMRPLAPMPL